MPAKLKRYLLNENGTCSNLKFVEMRVIAVIFPFMFEIPPEHIVLEITCAHVTIEMPVMSSEHVARLHISSHTPA